MRGAVVTRVAAGTALVGLALLAQTACEQLLGADFGDKPLAQCRPVLPPGPAATPASGAGFTIVAAVSSLDFGDLVGDGGPPLYPTIGFNLDGRCTSVLDSPACQPPAWTGVTVTDGVGGIDNQVGALLYSENDVFHSNPINSAFLNAQVASGAYAPLVVFRVSDYDGFDTDDQVRVELLVPTVSPGGAPPKWDGTDVFAIDPSSADRDLDGGVLARTVDEHAYVNGFTLVAHLGASGFSLANTSFILTDMVLSARLQTVGTAQFSMQGTLAGHGRNDDLLKVLPTLTKAFPGYAVCRDQTIYKQLKTWMCSQSDSLSDRGPSGPGAPCSAASFGVRFETRGVRLGGVAEVPPGGALCDAAVDPAGDTCLDPP